MRTLLLSNGEAVCPFLPTNNLSLATMPPLRLASAARSATATISALMGDCERAVRAATTEPQVVERRRFGGVGGRLGEEAGGDVGGSGSEE